MPKMIHIVMAAEGEYSDRTEWPIAAYLDEKSANERVCKEEQVQRAKVQEAQELYDKFKQRCVNRGLLGLTNAEIRIRNQLKDEMGVQDPEWVEYGLTRYFIHNVEIEDWQ